MKYLQVIWRLIVDLVLLCILIAILVSTEGKFESYVLALLGYVYIAVTVIFLYQQRHHRETIMGLMEVAEDIKRLLSDKWVDHDKAKAEIHSEMLKDYEKNNKLYLTTFFLRGGVIFLGGVVCFIKIVWTLLS